MDLDETWNISEGS